MKELSIEEKAKAYDRALEKARQLCDYPTSKPFISDLQDLFPELSEPYDEKMIGNIRRIIEQYALSKSAVDVNGELCEKEYIDADNWLKSIKERVQSQPKQEWSEEDENRLSDAVFFVREYQIPTRDKRLLNAAKEAEEWLKSLKDRYTWKPSDEQMKALDFAANYIVPAELCVKRKVLKELLEQLKKLREE